MKKTVLLVLAILLFITFTILGLILSRNIEIQEVKKQNSEFEYYLDKEIYGTEVASIINKAINQNEINQVQKNENGYYINNGKNSIEVEVKMTTIEATYRMEVFYDNGIESFVKNFNFIKFKCKNIEYHKETGLISKIVFEELEEPSY